MQSPTHSATQTSNFPGTSLPIADPALYDVRAHSPAYQPSRVGTHTFKNEAKVHPAVGRVRLLGHEATHTLQQTRGTR